jgi:hypothetical protein
MIVVGVIAGLWVVMLVFVLALCRMSARADAESERHWRTHGDPGTAPSPEARLPSPEARPPAPVPAGAPAGTRRARRPRGHRLTV